jgi:propanol-preferring alcohol dehydrogenase
MMRAWILEKQAKVEDRPLQLADIPTSPLEAGAVRIKVLVCGVCRTDIHIAEGDLALKKSPLVLGHEVVGTVAEVGRDAHRFAVGDRAGVYWLHSSCNECKYCLSGRENYCPAVRCTGWDEDGGFADYVTVPEDSALPLNEVHMEPAEIAPLMCPGIAGYAAFKLTGARKGDKLGLYGFGPTANCVLKVAQSLGIETYVSTRSEKNIQGAKREGADWAGDAAREPLPCNLDAAVVFPPAGNLVEPALARLEKGGILVMAPVSSSRIVIEDYSEHLWGRDIRTLYNINKADAEEFFGMVDRLDLHVGTTLFPFEELGEALILAKQGKLTQPNAVVAISE